MGCAVWIQCHHVTQRAGGEKVPNSLADRSHRPILRLRRLRPGPVTVDAMRRGLVAVLVLVAGCAPTSTAVSSTSMVPTTTTTVPTTTTTVPTTTTMATTTTINPYARPDWMGTRLLPLRPDEFGVVQPTPPEMQDRQFETLDVLPPPADEGFHSTIDTDPTRRPGPLQLGSGVPSDPRRAFLSDDVPLWIRPAFPHRGDDRERRRRGTGGRDLPETSRGSGSQSSRCGSSPRKR